MADKALAVVVGVDGTETSWNAFWWGCGAARRLGARAVAVFVSSSVPCSSAGAATVAAGLPFESGVLENAVEQEATVLEAELHVLAAEAGVELRFVHGRGDPAGELVRVAEECHAELIAVGRSTKAVHHLAGSIGKRLIARTGAPVVVVVP